MIEGELMTRVQVLDPQTHKLLGVIYTGDSSRAYVASLVPQGFAALVDWPGGRYDLLPWCTG
jgi:hypothetical protein